MEFDKSRVYTAVNADEVKAGSKGIFANTYASLQKKVSKEGTDEVDGSYLNANSHL